jgi:hypothetical protein
MWYDTVAQFEMKEEDMFSFLEEIAHDNKAYFRPDELMDECYPSVTYFGVEFLPSEIIRELTPYLYKEIWGEEIDMWVDEQIHELDMCDPDDGDTLDMYIDLPEAVDNLKTVVWREEK